ncbi:MAG TPA: hypothetical protein VNL77_25510 [Roseiflexaceae bacterium]|nr:hypothetical protein [Roseiflexaceae bacterium]
MPDLPIRRLVIYKHGVGYFERRGPLSGSSLRLSFPREAMDDVLKSLVALDLGAGRVLGVDFETPEDRAARVSRGSIHLSDERSLLDLLRDLRGRRVRLYLSDRRWAMGGRPGGVPPAPDAPGAQLESPPPSPAAHRLSPVEGVVLGVDVAEEEPLKAPLVSLYIPEERQVRPLGVRQIERLELLDERAAEDLAYFLRASQSEEDRRAATLRLSEGDHDLLVGYVAPAPAWRVSYRVLFEPTNDERPSTNDQQSMTNAESRPERGAVRSSFVVGRSSVLLQGWGLFDNQLDEDLEGVELTLVAGMPVSFRYRLYEPHIPERPLVADETRTVAGPIEFAGMVAEAEPPSPLLRMGPPAMARGMMVADAAAEMAGAPAPAAFSMEAAEASAQAELVGEERGALFQYRVAHPVTVARGQSAMVPIVSQRLEGHKELLYNGAKLPRHPVASLRMRNETGLTLERGPATVVEEGDYAGEAVLPFTRAGSELILPYAVELGISVAEEHRSERQLAGVSVRDEYLLLEEWDVQRAVYRIASTLAAPAIVTVEQPLLHGYELFDTPPPSEQSQGVARWEVRCPPGAETTFAVLQRMKTARREHVRGVSGPQLRDYLRRRFLDEATFQALARVLHIYAQIGQAQARLQQIEQERQRIYRRQQQTQQSLTPLGREGDEGALRTRYVALLGELEDQLGTLGAEEGRLQQEIQRLEAAAAQALQALSKP